MSGFGECGACGASVDPFVWETLCPACEEAEAECPDCDGDGYIDLFDDDGFVIGPGPCPRGCHPGGVSA